MTTLTTIATLLLALGGPPLLAIVSKQFLDDSSSLTAYGQIIQPTGKGLKACWSWDGIPGFPVECVCIKPHVGEVVETADWSTCRRRGWRMPRPDLCRRFILLRQNAEAKNAEINRELAVLKRAYSLGIRAGKILNKHYIPTLKQDNVRTGFFESDKFQAVLRYLSQPLRALMTFIHITGWRKSDVLPLQWRQIDFSNGTVTLDPGTTER